MTDPAAPRHFGKLELVLVVLVGPLLGGMGVNAMVCVAFALVLADVDWNGLFLGTAPADAEQLTERVMEAVTSLPVSGLNLGLTAFFFSVPAILWARRRGLPVAQTFGLVRPVHPAFYLLAPLGTLALGPISDGLVRVMRHVAPNATMGALDQIEAMVAGAPVWLGILLFACLPGFGEEFLFRGTIQRALGRGRSAITISALTFAAIHVDPHHVAGVIPIGFYLAVVADRAGSIAPTILAHAVNNAVAVLAMRFAEGGEDESFSYALLAAGAAIAGACTMLVVRFGRRVPSAGTVVGASGAHLPRDEVAR